MDNPSMYFVPNSNVSSYSNHHNACIQPKHIGHRMYVDTQTNAKSTVFMQYGHMICSVVYMIGH